MAVFDAEKATQAYIDGLGAEALEKSAAYTVGNHWLLLWGLVVGAIVTFIIVRTGILEKLAGKLGKRSWALRTFLITAAFFLVSSLITLPWTIYESWLRQHGYGMSSQPLGDFLMQTSMGVAIGSVVGGLFFLGVYALIRRTGKTWWLWSGGLAALGLVAMQLLGPILIEPLFNEFKPLPQGPVKTALVEMAKEADIPEDRIFMFDGSRQSNNFTANVSGIGSSARIAISDVALKNASIDEVKAVTGHEIGHYVLGHIWRFVIILPLLVIFLFFVADRLYTRAAKLFGSKAEISDPVGIPILLFVASLCSIIATPVMNTVTRMGESESDAYSMQMVNLPDALAGALVKTAEYRYPRPHPVQEAIFYTHPSVERRVRAAMEWKAAHPAGGAVSDKE